MSAAITSDLTASPPRALTIRGTCYPVDLPSIRDARLHASFVVLTIHVLGQIAFGFRVSVPQIVSAIGACAFFEVLVTARRLRRITWPASAILTGSGVGLILRVDGTAAWDHWTWHAWYLFAGTAVLSLATKYLLRVRGEQVFNPSNVGLLTVFVVLGASRVEPLDLWWHRWNVPVALAYVVIVTGGLVITKRLGLIGMAAGFWVTLGCGCILLARSRHCITSDWSLRPVCDAAFARLMLSSPEILIFTFFMLTDPRTSPRTPTRRVGFGISVAVVSLLLLAPSRTEFGTKVALFAGLAIVCAGRALLRLVTAWAQRAQLAGARRLLSSELGGIALGAASPVLLVGGVFSIVQLGIPARVAFSNVVVSELADPRSIVPNLLVAAAPTVLSIEPAVLQLDPTLADSATSRTMQALTVALAMEQEALRRRDATLLASVDHGTRLVELRTVIASAARTGSLTSVRYTLDTARLRVVRGGGQSGALVGIEATGTETSIGIDAAGHVRSDSPAPVTRLFLLRPFGGTRWLLADVRDARSGR